MWKSSLENTDPYAGDLSRGSGPLAGDLRRKLSLESQRLRARLTQELRELQERLAAAFVTNPAPSPPPGPSPAARERLAALALRLHHALDSDARELCSRLTRYAQAPETADRSEPAACYQDAARGIGQALDDGERQLNARLEEFREEVASTAGGAGDPSAALRREVEAFGVRVRSRGQALRAGLAGTQSFGEVLSNHVERFCRSSAEENRLFADSVERQLEALRRGQSELPAEVPSVSSSSMGSLGEDFSPKLSALLQDILQTLN